MDPEERDIISKKIFSSSDNKGHSMNTCTKFHEKILNDSHEIK